MKKLFALLTALFCLLPLCGTAEVYRIQNASRLPADWYDRELLQLTVIDTDRSDAMLLQCGGEAMMVDGGEAGYFKRVKATLEERGITHLKYLYSTHGDGDHVGGLVKLLSSRQFTTGAYLTPYSDKTPRQKDGALTAAALVASRKITYQQIHNLDRIALGGAELTVIRMEVDTTTNDSSAMCQVRFGDSRLLLTADCGNATMRHFLGNRDHDLFRCDVMKIMHHGINGIISEFLDVAQPELVFVTNIPGNLESTTLPQLRRMDALFSGSGTLHMETDGKDWYVWQDKNWVD